MLGKGTGTIFRPLFFEFPDDDWLDNNDFEFMIGEALLFAPVYYPGEYSRKSTWLKVNLKFINK